jgi:hypothetical protein
LAASESALSYLTAGYSNVRFFVVDKCTAADATDALCDPMEMKLIMFLVMEHRWNEIDRGKRKYSGKKPVPVPLCPPQIPHGLTRDRTRASAVGGRRLTA